MARSRGSRINIFSSPSRTPVEKVIAMEGEAVEEERDSGSHSRRDSKIDLVVVAASTEERARTLLPAEADAQTAEEKIRSRSRSQSQSQLRVALAEQVSQADATSKKEKAETPLETKASTKQSLASIATATGEHQQLRTNTGLRAVEGASVPSVPPGSNYTTNGNGMLNTGNAAQQSTLDGISEELREQFTSYTALLDNVSLAEDVVTRYATLATTFSKHHHNLWALLSPQARIKTATMHVRLDSRLSGPMNSICKFWALTEQAVIRDLDPYSLMSRGFMEELRKATKLPVCKSVTWTQLVEAVALTAKARADRPIGGRGGQPRSWHPISSDIPQACAVLTKTYNTTKSLPDLSSVQPQLQPPSHPNSVGSNAKDSHFAHADQKPEAKTTQLNINGSFKQDRTVDHGVTDGGSAILSEQLTASNITKRRAKGRKRFRGDGDVVFSTAKRPRLSSIEEELRSNPFSATEDKLITPDTKRTRLKSSSSSSSSESDGSIEVGRGADGFEIDEEDWAHYPLSLSPEPSIVGSSRTSPGKDVTTFSEHLAAASPLDPVSSDAVGTWLGLNDAATVNSSVDKLVLQARLQDRSNGRQAWISDRDIENILYDLVGQKRVQEQVVVLPPLPVLEERQKFKLPFRSKRQFPSKPIVAVLNIPELHHIALIQFDAVDHTASLIDSMIATTTVTDHHLESVAAAVVEWYSGSWQDDDWRFNCSAVDQIPQQQNFVDCGIFALVGVLHILSDRDFDMNVDGRSWRQVLSAMLDILPRDMDADDLTLNFTERFEIEQQPTESDPTPDLITRVKLLQRRVNKLEASKSKLHQAQQTCDQLHLCLFGARFSKTRLAVLDDAVKTCQERLESVRAVGDAHVGRFAEIERLLLEDCIAAREATRRAQNEVEAANSVLEKLERLRQWLREKKAWVIRTELGSLRAKLDKLDEIAR